MHFLHLILELIPGYKKIRATHKLLGISLILLIFGSVSYLQFLDFMTHSLTCRAHVVSQRTSGKTYIPMYSFQISDGSTVNAEETSWQGAEKNMGTSALRPYAINEELVVRYDVGTPSIVTDSVFDDPIAKFSIGFPLGFGGMLFVLWLICMAYINRTKLRFAGKGTLEHIQVDHSKIDGAEAMRLMKEKQDRQTSLLKTYPDLREKGAKKKQKN